MTVTSDDFIAALPWGVLAAHDQWYKPTPMHKPKRNRPLDSTMVAAASAGVIPPELLRKWLSDYKVLRGAWASNKNGALNGVVQRIGEALNQNYGGKGGVRRVQAGERWDVAVKVISEITKQQNRSLCMKAMWLYGPDELTMWDSYAANGLHEMGLTALRKVRNGDDAGEFLKGFEELLSEYGPQAKVIAENIAGDLDSIPYSYIPRILDKTLWLVGSKKPFAEKQSDQRCAIGYALARYTECKAALTPAITRFGCIMPPWEPQDREIDPE